MAKFGKVKAKEPEPTPEVETVTLADLARLLEALRLEVKALTYQARSEDADKVEGLEKESDQLAQGKDVTDG